MNLLAGRVADAGRFVLDTGGELQVAASEPGPAIAVIDPNAVSLFAAEPHGRCAIRAAVVSDVDQAPDRVRVHFRAPIKLIAEVTPAGAAELAIRRRASSCGGAR